MADIKDKVLELIQNSLATFWTVKLHVELFGYYVLESQGLSDVKSFMTKNRVVTVSTVLTDLYDDFTAILDKRASEFDERESGA